MNIFRRAKTVPADRALGPGGRPATTRGALLLAAALLLLAGGVPPAGAATIDGQPPYPPSDAVSDIALDWSTFRREGFDSDNWPTTWAADGTVYTTWGDGGGIGGPEASRQAYVSIGVARITGSTARSFRGTNLIGGLNPQVGRCFPKLGGLTDRRVFRGRTFPCRTEGLHGKSWSILALDGRLHMFITPASLNKGYDEARLHTAPLGTNNWSRASWAFTRRDNPPLLSPNIAQAGRNNALASHVYAYATRHAPVGRFGLHKGPNGGELHLLRAAKGADLTRRESWEFFSGSATAPAWSAQQGASRPVFVDPRGVSWLTSAILVPSLGRWVLMAEHDVSHAGNLGIFEAPQPWGPFRTIFYGTLANPARDVPPTAFYSSLLANSLTAGGGFTLFFTGTDANDALNAVDGRFVR